MAQSISAVTPGLSANDVLRQFSSRVSESQARQFAAASRRGGPPRDRRLPRLVLLGFQIATALFARMSLTDVFAQLLPGFAGARTLSASVIAQGRARLGWLPFRQLAAYLRRLTPPAECPSAFYRGLRLLAVDGTSLTMPDTPANARAFGYHVAGGGRSHCPLLRLVALVELGTHTFLNWVVKPNKTSEIPMGRSLIRHLEEGQLLLLDAAFHSFALTRAVRDRGGHLLGRVASGPLLQRRQELVDGSSLARLYRTARDRHLDRHGLDVRVIEYRHHDPRRTRCGLRTRLVTTLLDPATAPAWELVELYHVRWEQELAFRELKAQLADRRTHVRSQTPLGVLQDVEGLMIAHGLLRTVMAEAAHRHGLPPLELSFVQTLRIVQRHGRDRPGEPGQPDFPTWWAGLLDAIAQTRQKPRRNRIYPRVIKAGRNKFPSKKTHHQGTTTTPFRDSIEIT